MLAQAIYVDEPTVSFSGKGSGRDKKPLGVNIGKAFLKDFVVTIDYRSKRVMLERFKSYSPVLTCTVADATQSFRKTQIEAETMLEFQPVDSSAIRYLVVPRYNAHA